MMGPLVLARLILGILSMWGSVNPSDGMPVRDGIADSGEPLEKLMTGVPERLYFVAKTMLN